MVNTFSDVLLGEPFKTCPFGQDHAQHCVDVFNTGLLAAAHGVAVIDAGSAKFRVVCDDHVGGLPLFNEGTDHPVDGPPLAIRQIDTFP